MTVAQKLVYKKLPKIAATKIPKSESYIQSNVLVISVNKASRISALTVTLYARKTTLNISKVRYLPEYSCSKTFGPEQDTFFPYSISFVCRSALVRRSAYKLSNFVVIFFTGDVSCENNCDYKLKKDDDVDLFEIDLASEDCSKPDFPPYGHARSWPRNRTAYGKSQDLYKDLFKVHNDATNQTLPATNLTASSNQTTNSSMMKTTTPLPITMKKTVTSSSTASTGITSSIAPSTTELSAAHSKLPPHFYDSINSDITSSDSVSNETATESPNFTSPNEPASLNKTSNATKTESNKQKYYCNQHFRMNIADSEDFDEVMSLSRYSIKQFEKCDKGEDWQYHRKQPECLPETYCVVPPIPDNVIPSYSSLYLNQYSVVHDEITFECLNNETDVNIGGSLMACLTDGNWSGLPPRCVTKNLNLAGNSGIVYLSISVSLVSLIILVLAIYCAIKLNHTANKAVRVFNEQHQQLVQQQNLSAQSSLNSSLVPDSIYSASLSQTYGQAVNEGRELPNVPSLYRENIYESVQNEPRYVDFRTYHLEQAKQQPSTWDSIKRKLKKQDNVQDDLKTMTYRRAARDSVDFEGYDYIDLKKNDPNMKQIGDQIVIGLQKQSTFKSDTPF